MPRPKALVAPKLLRHKWSPLGKLERCGHCGLFRRKAGRIDQTRGDTRHYEYRSRIGSDWTQTESACFDPRQEDIFEQPIDSEVLGKSGEGGIEDMATVAGKDINTVGSSKPDASVSQREQRGSNENTSPASLWGIIEFTFDPLGRWGGVEKNWRVYVEGPPAAKGFEKIITETFPYAEEYAKTLLKFLRKSALISNGVKVIIEVDGEPFRVWLWRTTDFQLIHEGDLG